MHIHAQAELAAKKQHGGLQILQGPFNRLSATLAMIPGRARTCCLQGCMDDALIEAGGPGRMLRHLRPTGTHPHSATLAAPLCL